MPTSNPPALLLATSESHQQKGRGPYGRAPTFLVIAGEREGRTLPPAIGPVMPNLISNVAAEKAARLFGPRILAVEESAGGKVVNIATLFKLLVRDEGLFGVILHVAEAL